MQMSRSVTTPTVLPPSATTGNIPQSIFHIVRAASLRLVSGRQVFAPCVMIHFTFISLPPSVLKRVSPPTLGRICEELHGSCFWASSTNEIIGLIFHFL